MIYWRPEVAGEAISWENVRTIEGYALLNLETAIVSGFRENQNVPFSERIA